MGTSFNVRSMPATDQLDVFVSIGSVSVTLKQTGEKITLKPGELLTVDFTSNTSNKTTDENGKAIAWKKQSLNFNNQPLSDVIKALGAEHEVDFEMKSKTLKDCPFTINLNLLTLEEAIEGIGEACGIGIKEKGNHQYEVTGNCCE